jgi:hypothetical protein
MYLDHTHFPPTPPGPVPFPKELEGKSCKEENLL